MTDTIISNAVVFPQDEGLPNIADGSESWASAGLLSLLATAGNSGPFINDGLAFTAHDATADQVDITAGTAFLSLDETTVTVQSSLGGSSPPAYDVTLPTPGAIGIIVPSTIADLSLSAGLNPVWIAFATDSSVSGVSPGDVYIRHGSGETSPPHPTLKIGETNPDDATQDFRSGNDNPANRGRWREDPNSPFEGTVTASQIDLPLAGRYDEVRIEGTVWTDRAQDGGFDLRINNDATANYNRWINGSDETLGMTSWGSACRLSNSSYDIDGAMAGSFDFLIDGRWPAGGPHPSISRSYSAMQKTGGGVNPFSSGTHTGSLAPPLEVINILPTNTIGYDISLYGRQTTRPNL